MVVAASSACSLSSDSPPKHAGATASKGISSSVGCWAEALLAGLLWSNHLMRTFGLRRWRFLHGRLSWATGMHCESPIRWFSAALIWSVYDSEENMKVTCSSSIAYMSWASGSCIPCRMHSGVWLPVLLSLGTLCPAPAFPQAVGAAVLAWTVRCWVQFSLGMFSCSCPWETAELQQLLEHWCALGLCCRFMVTIHLLGSCCTFGVGVGVLGLTELAGAAARWSLQFGFFPCCCFAAFKSEDCFQLGSCSQSQCCSK